MRAEILHFNKKLKVHRKLNYLAHFRSSIERLFDRSDIDTGFASFARDFLPTALTCGWWQSPYLFIYLFNILGPPHSGFYGLRQSSYSTVQYTALQYLHTLATTQYIHRHITVGTSPERKKKSKIHLEQWPCFGYDY